MSADRRATADQNAAAEAPGVDGEGTASRDDVHPRAVRVAIAPPTALAGDPTLVVAPAGAPAGAPAVAAAGAPGGAPHGVTPGSADGLGLIGGAAIVDGEPAGVRLRRLDGARAVLEIEAGADPGAAGGRPDDGVHHEASAADAGGGAEGPADADGGAEGPADDDAPAGRIATGHAGAARAGVGRAPAAKRTRVLLGPLRRGPDGRTLLREVVVGGWRFEVTVEREQSTRLRARARRGEAGGTAGGSVEVRAIIPGRVVAISVAPGDAVIAGQQILVVEAMKMQNELRAPREGSVDRVGVAVGDTIEVGDLLVVIH
jgi:biotin carboxyl carrier protein